MNAKKVLMFASGVSAGFVLMYMAGQALVPYTNQMAAELAALNRLQSDIDEMDALRVPYEIV